MKQSSQKERALEVCLQSIQSGASLEEALKLYPQWTDELRPLLEAAQVARQAGAAILTPKAAQARSRAQFLAAAQRRARPKLAFSPWASAWKPILAVLAVLFVLLVGAAGTAVVSAQALPGNVLYPVKLAAEQTRLFLATNPSKRLELEQSFDQERIEEVETLIQRARSQSVSFAGYVSQIQAEEWLVDSVRVQITSQTQLDSKIKINDYVGVEGILLTDGRVLAERVELREFKISGRLEEISGDLWEISGITVVVTADTVVNGSPMTGSTVKVTGILLPDESLQAQVIQIISMPIKPALRGATRTPEPENTAEATGNLEATPSLDSHKDPGLGETPEATRPDEHAINWPTEPTRSEEPKSTSQPYHTQHPTAVHDPTRTPKPTDHDKDHQTSTRTNSPRPTETPRPTQTDEPIHPPQPTQTGEPLETPHD